MSTDTVTREQAEQTLAAIKGQYAAYFEPITNDDGKVLVEASPEPTLLADFDGRDWTIVWEEGPDEWVYTLDGGSSEEDRVLMAEASAEFGTDLGTPNRPAAVFPAGVFVEPINSISVGVYPA